MPSSMSDLFAFLTSLMNTHAAMFQAIGLNLFRAFAVTILVWFGIKTALGARGFHWERFAALVLLLSFGLAMLRFYDTPVPGIGLSFYHIIVDQGLILANQLNHATVQEVWDRLNGLYFGLETPGLSMVINVAEGFRWGLTSFMIMMAEAAVFVVIAFGYIAEAIAVLLGPIFIPFVIVPNMEWLFWGWFKCLIQYAFYPVVANAYVFVFGQLLIHFVDVHPPPYDGATLAGLFLPLLMMLIAFTYGVVRVPSLVNSLFTGRSGDHALPRL